MPTIVSGESAHAPVANRAKAPSRRFSSVDPTMGANNNRHPLDAQGFEAFAGLALPAPAPGPPAPSRAVSELTFGPPAAAPMAAAPGQPVEVPDTTVYPWRANAFLKIQVPGRSEIFTGTGWFVGPYAVITAAHAVFIRESGGYVGWASQIEVVPGQNGTGDEPFGNSLSTAFQCPQGWQSDGDDRVDYGVILLGQGLGSTVGTFGYSTFSDSDILSAVANLGGYPAVPPPPGEPPGRQWFTAGNILQVDDYFVYYQLATAPGDSGAAVYRNIGNNSYVMAIHTSASGTQNRGVRITGPIFDNIQQWASMHA